MTFFLNEYDKNKLVDLQGYIKFTGSEITSQRYVASNGLYYSAVKPYDVEVSQPGLINLYKCDVTFYYVYRDFNIFSRSFIA